MAYLKCFKKQRRNRYQKHVFLGSAFNGSINRYAFRLFLARGVFGLGAEALHSFQKAATNGSLSSLLIVRGELSCEHLR